MLQTYLKSLKQIAFGLGIFLTSHYIAPDLALETTALVHFLDFLVTSKPIKYISHLQIAL